MTRKCDIKFARFVWRIKKLQRYYFYCSLKINFNKIFIIETASTSTRNNHLQRQQSNLFQRNHRFEQRLFSVITQLYIYIYMQLLILLYLIKPQLNVEMSSSFLIKRDDESRAVECHDIITKMH